MYDVLVVGGGISGATLLHRLAMCGVDVHLLEGGDRLGGVIGSAWSPQGFLAETGPNSTSINVELLELIRDLDLESDLLYASGHAANRFVVRDGRLHAVPTDPLSFLRTPLFSRRAKLRLLRERWIAPLSDDIEESVANFVERRLGGEFLAYAIDPLVGGIFAGNPDRLSLRYAFPAMHRMEQECRSILRAAVRKAIATRKQRRRGHPLPPKGLISFTQGMGMLPARISDMWSSRVTCGVRVERIERDDEGWSVVGGGDRFTSRNVVIAVDAACAADLVEPFDSVTATALRSIDYPPVAVAVSQYARHAVNHPLNGFGMLIPSRERAGILGTLFSSTLFPNRAPEGTVLLTTFVGGSRSPDAARLPGSDIEELVHADLRRYLGISAPPLAFALHRWERAIPQYALGYGGVLEAIENAERTHAGLFLAGNYRGGISVGDCVRTVTALANRMAQGLDPLRTIDTDGGSTAGNPCMNHQES